MPSERAVKEALNRNLAERVAESATELIVGNAKFENAHTIQVSTGSESQVIWAEFPFGAPGVFDCDTILELNTIPKSVTVAGAGAAGSEYACTFGAPGTDVHRIDGRDVLFRFLDREVWEALTRAMTGTGIRFI